MMKKRILAICMALCMVMAVMPVAFAAEGDGETAITVTTEEELKNAVSADANYAIVTLGKDITLSNTLTVSRGVTVSGGDAKHTLTYAGTDYSGAVEINTNAPVVMDQLTVTVTNGNARGINLATTSPKFTFSNSELNAQLRGIWVGGDYCDSDSYIKVIHSTIQNNQIPESKTYDNWTALGDYRGIALWGMNHSKVEIINSEILGYGYSVNLAGDLDADTKTLDYNNTEIIVTDSTIKGWTAFNVWSSNTIFTITDSTLKGINRSNGPTDGFAAIVVNDDLYNYGWGGADANQFTINGGTITSYRSGTAPESLFRIDRDGVTKVTFGPGKDGAAVEFVDGTGDSYSVFYSGYGEEDTTDWADFMKNKVSGQRYCTLTGYEGRRLMWSPDDIPATSVTLSETTLSLVEGDTATLTAAVEPAYTTDTVEWTSSNESVATVADGLVTAVGPGTAIITAAAGGFSDICAVTVEARAVTVTFEGAEDVAPIKVLPGETITLPTPDDTTDQIFRYWTVEGDPVGTRYYGGEEFTANEDITFVANWKDNSYIPIPPTQPTKPAEPDEPDTPDEPDVPDEPDTPDVPASDYADVQEDAWYAEAVDYVTAEGLMTGTTADAFAPDVTTTRAMIWTILGRMSGASVSGGEPWYALAQSWAVSSGVSDGSDPDSKITREQLAAMLYRYAGEPELLDSELAGLSGYADHGDVSSYAYRAMAWAVSRGIINGVDGTLVPQNLATRAQVAAMLMRYRELSK